MTTSTQASRVTTAINGLGLDLHRSRVQAFPEGNGLHSPFALQLALAMTYAGAAGETRAEMRSVLHFPEDEAELHAGLAGLAARLNAAAEQLRQIEERLPAKHRGKAPLELHVASRLFGQRGGAFLQPFLEVLEQRYGAALEALDMDDPEGARVTINRWAEESTGGKIRGLVPPGQIRSTTRLVPASALYLRAAWSKPFSKSATKPMPFLVRGSERVLTPMMTRKADYGYAQHDGFGALALPYIGDELQLLVLLPDEPDGLAALERGLTAELLGSFAQLPRHVFTLWIPGFRLSPPGVDLRSVLEGLGMRTAFDEPEGSADFSRMAPRAMGDYLGMSAVFHGAQVDVSEEGTTASAVTAASMVMMGRPHAPIPIEIHVDHPFLFAIQETQSGACLMLGRVTDPR
jgi:serpin B